MESDLLSLLQVPYCMLYSLTLSTWLSRLSSYIKPEHPVQKMAAQRLTCECPHCNTCKEQAVNSFYQEIVISVSPLHSTALGMATQKYVERRLPQRSFRWSGGFSLWHRDIHCASICSFLRADHEAYLPTTAFNQWMWGWKSNDQLLR